jgi:hypothetical protein
MLVAVILQPFVRTPLTDGFYGHKYTKNFVTTPGKRGF